MSYKNYIQSEYGPVMSNIIETRVYVIGRSSKPCQGLHHLNGVLAFPFLHVCQSRNIWRSLSKWCLAKIVLEVWEKQGFLVSCEERYFEPQSMCNSSPTVQSAWQKISPKNPYLFSTWVLSVWDLALFLYKRTEQETPLIDIFIIYGNPWLVLLALLHTTISPY